MRKIPIILGIIIALIGMERPYAQEGIITSVPISVFVGIALDYSNPGYVKFGVYAYDGHWSFDYHEEKYIQGSNNRLASRAAHLDEKDELNDAIVTFLENYQRQRNCKIVMAGLVNSDKADLYKLSRRLWFELDVLSLVLDASGSTLGEKACSAARKTNQRTSLSDIPGLFQPNVGDHKEVEVNVNGRMTYCSLEDYQKFFQEETWEKIIKTSKMVKDASKTIIFFNATMQGGGVAILRHSTIRFYNLLGINARWFVMKPSPDVFNITKKKFHNVLQGVAQPDVRFTTEDKHLYEKWCEENVKNYWSYNNSPIYTADVIVFDDPQTVGLIPHVKKMNPHATLVYRSHIEIRSDLIAELGSIQREVWDYLWSFIRHCDIFISHPVATFVPKEVKDSHMKIRYMPATTDPCDGLNKKLDPYSFQYYQLLFNRIAFDQIGRRVDFERRPYFVQISRFDPSKGISDLIDAYMLFRNKISDQMALDERMVVDTTKIPQLVITGHGSIDDPEGDTIYKQTIEKLNKIRDLNNKNSQWVNDVIVVRLGPSDQMLNTILTGAVVAFQLSIREGFEVKISEALLKGIPVVAYNSGGISLQIEDGKDGYLVERGDLTAVCDAMYKLVTDPEHLKKLKDTAKNKQREWILSPSNVLQWNKILLEVVSEKGK